MSMVAILEPHLKVNIYTLALTHSAQIIMLICLSVITVYSTHVQCNSDRKSTDRHTDRFCKDDERKSHYHPTMLTDLI